MNRYLEAYLEGIANAKGKKYQKAVATFDRAEQLIDLLSDKGFSYSTKADAHVRIHRARLRFLAEYCPKPLGMICAMEAAGRLTTMRGCPDYPRSVQPLRVIGGPVKLKDGSEYAVEKVRQPRWFSGL